MALTDLLIRNSLALAVNLGSGWVDMVSQSSITPTGTTASLDPIVSGSSSSIYIPKNPGTAGNGTLTVTVPQLSTLPEFSIEAYLHFDYAISGSVLKVGATDLLYVNSGGYITVTPPYIGATPINIDFQPFDVTQFAISCTGTRYDVFVNGYRVGGGTESGGYVTATTLVFSESTINKALGCISLSDVETEEVGLQKRLLEALARSDDQYNLFDTTVLNIKESVQNYSTVLDLPLHYKWSDYLSYGLTSDPGIRLKTKKISRFDEQIGCHVIDDIMRYTGKTGSVLIRIPSPGYGTSATTRGILHIRSSLVEANRYTIQVASNQLQYIQRTVSHSDTGQDTSTNSTPVNFGSPLTGGSNPVVGFVWDSTGLSVFKDGVKTLITDTFSPDTLSAYVGVDASLTNGYYSYANRASWNWEVRAWPTAATSVAASDYGPHMLTMSGTNTAVSAEASFSVEVPLYTAQAAGQQKIKDPYLWVDGAPTITGSAI
jgi:hypothetical protein